MKSSKITIMLVLTISLTIILGVMLFITTQHKNEKETLQMFSIGTATMPGYIGVEIYYDVEPVTLMLKSPDGKVYTRDYASVYNIDPTIKVITMLVDSDSIGEWKMVINKLNNQDLGFKFVNTTSPTLYITDASLIEKNGLFYVKFCPIMSTHDEAPVHYNVSLFNDTYNKMLTDKDLVAGINETAYFPFNPENDAYTDSDYTIRVVAKLLNGTQSAYADTQVHLSSKNRMIEKGNK